MPFLAIWTSPFLKNFSVDYTPTNSSPHLRWSLSLNDPHLKILKKALPDIDLFALNLAEIFPCLGMGVSPRPRLGCRV